MARPDASLTPRGMLFEILVNVSPPSIDTKTPPVFPNGSGAKRDDAQITLGLALEILTFEKGLYPIQGDKFASFQLLPKSSERFTPPKVTVKTRSGSEVEFAIFEINGPNPLRASDSNSQEFPPSSERRTNPPCDVPMMRFGSL